MGLGARIRDQGSRKILSYIWIHGSEKQGILDPRHCLKFHCYLGKRRLKLLLLPEFEGILLVSSRNRTKVCNN